MGELYGGLLVKQILRVLNSTLKNSRIFYPKKFEKYSLCHLNVKFPLSLFLIKVTTLRVEQE
jgi:hypothetical protein